MDFPKSFDPHESERRWYDEWVSRGYFKPETNPAAGEPYCIVIPPPNVTGQLHMGHALNATVHDVLVRWKRMQGYRALWIPGTDHAGIATQNVVERQLEKEGTDRHKMGRDAFTSRVWEWKKEYGGRIINQLKKVGSSCDWSRERFTMDEGLSKAVREVFVRLYEEGLIYRDTKLINWCPRCKTALSDLEVDHEDIEGTLTYIKYPLSEGGGFVTVATTRPETMLGDTAVAVNPEDERYKAHIGKQIDLPLTNRRIPIVADTQVDPAFGTGAVKVTPAHDFNDEAIAKRQSPELPAITVIGDEGRMTKDAGEKYAGLDRYDCRRKVVDDLKALGLIEKADRHAHSVGHCYRCKTVIEPYATPQWFVKVAPLAETAMQVVRDKRVKLIPEGWENSYFAWMENIRDWCITRQIWWGHRVPVWYCKDCGITIVSRTDVTSCPECYSKNVNQDPDVLDTWFSSALWPFSTLGWPDKTPDLAAFYPTSVLITGFDILFFWVARMIMMGCKFMGDVPFRHVYIHALVRDKDGQKMSKSKGNVIDPLTITEKFGADAFRFTFAIFAAQGRDVRFSEERVEGYRHFINKLWNATRFVLMNLGEHYRPKHHKDLASHAARMASEGDLATKWILSRLSATVDEVNTALEDYRLNDAANAVYQFTWRELCDWYIEMSKTQMSDDVAHVLVYLIETVLRLLHPFMPFVTEEIWQQLPVIHETDHIVVASFPRSLPANKQAESDMASVMEAVLGVRNMRGELNVPPKAELEILIKADTPEVEAALRTNSGYIEKLAKCRVSEISTTATRPTGALMAARPGMEVYVKLEGIDLSAEADRLRKELKKVQDTLNMLGRKLHNQDFLARAPKDIVEKEQAKYDEAKAQYEKITASLSLMEGAS